MASRKQTPTSFSTFKIITDLNALLMFSVIPFAVLLPFLGLGTAMSYGVAVGAFGLLLAMTDEGFRMGYESGIQEEYESYLKSEEAG